MKIPPGQSSWNCGALAAIRLALAIGPIGRIRRIGPIFLLPLGLALSAAPAGAAAAPTAPAAKSPAAAPASAGALGQNLDYLRIHEAPADFISAKSAATGPLVLDLRFASINAHDGFSVSGWLAARARTNAPVFVLVNAATASVLLESLAPGYLPSGVITLAPAGAKPSADITVDVDPETDRLAYGAFEKGVALASLVAAPSEKQRFDESELIRRDAEAANGRSNPVTAPNPSRRVVPPPPPLVDALLQRAVQLHRSLLALGRLK